ncbi:hypothetical protein [Nocardia fluminea]|uniref:hypothetical protein n=1 Tax=Nocardia fluminea TaxID=134984 RepID=UPI00365A3623
MTEPTNTARPIATTAALEPIYEVKNTVTGDQFVIYAPGAHDDRGMYTVAHVTGTASAIATPRIHLVHPDDITAYATGAVDRMRNGHAGHAARVWVNLTTGPMRAQLPR